MMRISNPQATDEYGDGINRRERRAAEKRNRVKSKPTRIGYSAEFDQRMLIVLLQQLASAPLPRLRDLIRDERSDLRRRVVKAEIEMLEIYLRAREVLENNHG